MALFQASVIKESLSQQDNTIIANAYLKFKKYFLNPQIQENIRKSKEEQFQEGFLRELFVNILGYTINPDPDYNLTTEFKNQTGAKKADGAILVDGKAIAVVELKSTKTKDLESIRQQAFDYKSNQANCIYVVTSNFERLRFYIENSVEFEDFDLFSLTEERFALLYFCLAKDNLLANIPLHAKKESVVKEEKITKQLYADYSLFKREIYRDIVKKNMNNPALRELTEKDIKRTLFKKTQKLLDRFLFIFFAEDKQLIPANSITQINDKWQDDVDFGEDKKLYDLYKQYFHILDVGRPKRGKRQEIFAYNGGLFKPDPILDALIIDDDLLKKHTSILTAYDFDTDVDVNILGHIFENSLNEIESINAEIEGVEFDKQKTKRKKDGVFYTPKYITKYIVDNTIGKLCEEKKVELEIRDDIYLFAKQRSRKRIENLEEYRKWLLQLTICDPACGSGAFLNQALDFLIKEHAYIDELTAKYNNEPMLLSDIENSILEHNIYGVDINEESVDIAKLSLWLRTAQKGRKLTSLNTNLKCGNSLIDDPKVAGDKAFNWQKEFPEIFQEKKKKAWHITTATHNSRYSQRMLDNNVKLGEAVWIDEESELIITKTIAEIVKEDKLNVIEYNLCGDHMHMLLVCTEDERDRIVGKIKSMSARAVNIATGRTVANYATRGQAPLSASVATPTERGETQTKFWTQKYGKSEIKEDNYLNNTIEYIRNNRIKHELPENKELEKIKNEFICSIEHAFRTEYNGGFDVVIGNPPYVRAELLGEYQEYLSNNYSLYNPSGDLFSYFYEKSFKLLKSNTGLFGFISNTFDKTTAGISIREYLQNEISFLKYIDFTEVQIFEGATTYPIILIAQNNKNDNNVFQYIKVPKSSQSPIIEIDLHPYVTVEQKTLDKINWSFKSKSSVNLISKLKENKTVREIYGKCYYGVKTALNEAFIISKAYEVGEHVKPIFEGKELSKWINSESVQQLILFESKWTKKEYGDDITEESGLQKLSNDYPDLLSHILPLKERAKKRYDKGDFFWELRNCAYYDLFEKPKIVFPNLQNSNKFSFDETGAYINAPAVILPTNDKFLLAILNSKLVWYFLTNICVVRSGGYIEVKPQYFEQIPIPEIYNKEDFELKTNIAIALTSNFQKIERTFIKYLQSKFNIEKLSKKLENWHELEFGEFIKELNKAIKKAGGNKLSKMDEMEWMEVFETKKAEAQAIKAEIDKTDKEIDQMVYELYGLTEEEIKIVEGEV